jgi:ubiquinone/menaquinone biosynthesis C-methylase UbiE
MTIPIKIISKEDYLKTTKKPNQEKVWDNIANPWKTYVVKIIPAVENFLKNKKGKIIDLGCGTGRNMIPNKDIEYTAVDFSEGQLFHLKKHIKTNKLNAKILKAEVNNLSKLKDNTFDYGIFIAALHCIETKEKRRQSLEELHRVLKPKGKAIITIWDSNDQRFKHIKNKGDIYMAWNHDNSAHMRYYYLYKKPELKKLIESIGFKIIKFSVYNEEAKNNIDRFNKKNWIIEIQKP